MAQRRMFSLLVTDTDAFLDMPLSTQALYFHLGMHGDDEGFVGSPKRIARSIGCNADDLKVLAAKGFIIAFESGVVVIRDWNVNNTLQNDRFHKSIYTEERAQLSLTKGKRYEFASVMEPTCIQDGSNIDTGCIQNDSRMEPELNITKLNVTKPKINNSSDSPDFEAFWKAYPRKQGKGNARTAFKKAKAKGVPLEKMIQAIEQQKCSKQWKTDGGQFIPLPATWLNQERWDDSLQVEVEEQTSNDFFEMCKEMERKEKGEVVNEQDGDSTSPFGSEGRLSNVLPWHG